MKHLALSLFFLTGCSATSAAPAPRPESAAGSESSTAAEIVEAPLPVNSTCPRSGKPVAADSLTEYRGFTVGFCNTHCRDDFAANVDTRPDDRRFFDSVIAALDQDEG